MKFSYFPGCTLKTKGVQLDTCGRKAAEALGFELCELPEWQCCGAVYPQATDEIATRLSSVRALAAADAAGQELVTLCSACHHVIKRVNGDMQRNDDIRMKVNNYHKHSEKARRSVAPPVSRASYQSMHASGSVSAGASISASSVPAVSAGAASGYAASLLASGTSGCTASVFVSAPQPLSSRAKQNSMAQKYRYFIPRFSLHRCAHPGAAMAAHTQRPRRTDRRGPPREAPARNSLCLPAFARR